MLVTYTKAIQDAAHLHEYLQVRLDTTTPGSTVDAVDVARGDQITVHVTSFGHSDPTIQSAINTALDAYTDDPSPEPP